MKSVLVLFEKKRIPRRLFYYVCTANLVDIGAEKDSKCNRVQYTCYVYSTGIGTLQEHEESKEKACRMRNIGTKVWSTTTDVLDGILLRNVNSD